MAGYGTSVVHSRLNATTRSNRNAAPKNSGRVFGTYSPLVILIINEFLYRDLACASLLLPEVGGRSLQRHCASHKKPFRELRSPWQAASGSLDQVEVPEGAEDRFASGSAFSTFVLAVDQPFLESASSFFKHLSAAGEGRWCAIHGPQGIKKGGFQAFGTDRSKTRS